MIRSMTGYARTEQATSAGRVIWELRAVNHRYLDLSFKLPDEFRALEPELRAIAAQQIGRGKVEAGLRFQREAAATNEVRLDEARLAAMLAALSRVSEQFPNPVAPDPVRILALPGVIRSDSGHDVAPPLAEALQQFRRTLEDFTATRAREGERTRHYLLDRLDQLADRVRQVGIRAPEVRDAWLERMQARLTELGVDVDATRLAQEAVMAAQRLDVDEELARLTGHLAEVRATLDRPEAVGRRLDFLMQELNREANTLSSKSQDADMTRHAVEMKVVIEQMREQVQNIE